MDLGRRGSRSPGPGPRGLLLLAYALASAVAEQEVENLSGLSPNPEKAIFVVRENGSICLMAEFAAKLIVPYDVSASNYVDTIPEQAYIPLSRAAEERGKCGNNESELQISWIDKAYTLRLFFVKESRNTSAGPEAWWKMSKVQFVYDSSERTYFKEAVNPGKHTVSTHHLSALVTPAGKSYECQAQQAINLASSDHQKSVVLLLSEVRLQPFDISSDYVFSEAPFPTALYLFEMSQAERCVIGQGKHHCSTAMIIPSMGSPCFDYSQALADVDMQPSIMIPSPVLVQPPRLPALPNLTKLHGKNYLWMSFLGFNCSVGSGGAFQRDSCRIVCTSCLSHVIRHKCPVDQREQLEETLPLVLGLILGLVIVITLGVYHIHLKMTANQVQIPRDRSEYKHMG